MTETARRSGDPLLSVVVIGRNDGYMGDYLYRLATALSFLGQSAERAGLLDDLEVIVVDWAGDRPLAADLPLTGPARRITRFLEVAPAIVRQRFGSVRWYSTCAVNVGVRRARGRFILFTDSDCLWTDPALASLARLLRGDTPLPVRVDEVYCYIRRYQIPWATVQRKPRLAEWARLSALLVGSAAPELPAAAFAGGFSAGQLMHRDVWHEVRGYDEALDRPWGWSDNDLMLRVSQRHTWIDVSAHGVFGLHMEHWPDTAGRATRDPSTINPMTIRNVVAPNGPDWGLADAEIPATTVSCASELPGGFGCDVPLTGATAEPAWHPSAEAAALVRRIGADGDPGVPPGQAEAIAQVLLTDRPMLVYWIGVISPPILQTMVTACPGMELFLINPWPEGVSDDEPFHPADLTGFIQNWGFRGWGRIVQGSPGTALERIAASSVGSPAPELAWVARGTQPDVVRALARRVAPGGVLFMPVDGDPARGLDAARARLHGYDVRALHTERLLIATRCAHSPRNDGMSVELHTEERADPADERARSLRVVFDMLLRDKALEPVDPDTLPLDAPILVVRSAHMGRMEAFFGQVAARSRTPRLHVLSHARDEAALRAMAPFAITFHAYPTPGPYRLDELPPTLLEHLRAIGFAALFYLDHGTRGDGLDEVERLLGAIRPEPLVCFFGNGTFAQARNAERRRLAEAAFLRLIEWYHFRLDPVADASR